MKKIKVYYKKKKTFIYNAKNENKIIKKPEINIKRNNETERVLVS
jgi:hypothetical protein